MGKNGNAEANGIRLCITGAAGYVGGMMCDQFSKRPDVAEIIAIDKEPMPALLRGNIKIRWITANLSDGSWQKQVEERKPEVMIHAAWQIREIYGKKAMQWKWNVEGSNAVFDFAFNAPYLRKLIYFSTASCYGAYPDNTLTHYFKEEEKFRDERYLYATEKKRAEENLTKKYEEWVRAGKRVPAVFVVRPAAITGPRGRYMFSRFGLMATLRNRLPKTAIYKFVSLMVNRIPVANDVWCRQMVHEDDVNDIIELLAFRAPTGERFEVFNLAPPGAPVLARDMAQIVDKKIIRVTPWIVRIAFFIFWHTTRGVVATSPGGWRYYCYPIVMDGSKISRMYQYKYRMGSRDALSRPEGRYAYAIPKEELKK